MFFGPRCDHFRKEVCDQLSLPITKVDEESQHAVRCIRHQEINLFADDTHVIEEVEQQEIGDEVLSIESLQKYYPVEDSSLASLLKPSDKRYVKANESLSFKAHSSETVAVVG